LTLKDTHITKLPANIEVGECLKLDGKSVMDLPEGMKLKSLEIKKSPITFLPNRLEIEEILKISETKIKVLPNDLKVGGRIYANYHYFYYLKSEMINIGIKDKSFMASGKLENFKRKDLFELIQKFGGVIENNVSNTLDFVIVGLKPSIVIIEEAKKIPSIKILSENDFIKLLMS